jgi:diguanylate cyclase (GGDEF)-like protein
LVLDETNADMNGPSRGFSGDLLGLISLLAITAFVVILLFVAARSPGESQMLAVLITGLGAGGVIFFRQFRKAASSLRASEARAHYAATHDARTRMANKALFLDRLADAAQTATAAQGALPAVICIGLDRFDEVTELLGFAGAEDVVAELALRLGSICQADDTAARLGDGMFALLRSGDDPARIEALADSLLGALHAPCEAAAGRTVITCSVGVSHVTAALETPAEALRQAQLALSNARKLGGARRRIFEPAMDHALKSRKSLEVELRRALAQGELAMVYQPQVDARGHLVGVEALMRWNSSSRGPISPSVFVPLAESCGLSDEVGVYALRHALLDARRWPGVKMAVNVSAAQIRAGDLIRTLKTSLAESGVAPRGVDLEITESVLLSDEPDILDTLAAARRLGFSLVLDDFGTGYSSLSYLRRFPIDKIKIDRSFVSHLGMRPESSAIVKAIVDLAEALELKVLAEGVETRAQVDRLLAIGCNHFQGYYYSPAVEPAVIDEIVASRATLAA